MAIPKITALYLEARELAHHSPEDYLKRGAPLGNKHTQTRLWTTRVRVILAYAPDWTRVWSHGHRSFATKPSWQVTPVRTSTLPAFFEQARSTPANVELGITAVKFAQLVGSYASVSVNQHLKLYDTPMREASGADMLQHVLDKFNEHANTVVLNPVALSIPASEANLSKLNNFSVAPWPLLLKAKACYKKHNIEV